MNRWVLFALGLAISVAVTVALWAAGIGGFALALLFPFALFGFRRRADTTAKACPLCGRSAREPGARFCPHDGTPLA